MRRNSRQTGGAAKVAVTLRVTRRRSLGCSIPGNHVNQARELHHAERDGYFHRRGITLFEVMLALAIFLGAFAAISQVIDLGRQASVAGQLENEAVLRAQTKLAEVIAGVEPMSALQGQAFEDDPNWTWGLEMGDGPHVDLLGLTVTVEHVRPNGSIDASYMLTRMVRDPQLFIDAAASASLSEEES
jgi:general secretion pathway protein I